jgi:hypothetical protein
MQLGGRTCGRRLSDFSYKKFQAPVGGNLGLSRIALRSFRGMCLPIKAGDNG